MSDTPTLDDHASALTGCWLVVSNYDLTSRISGCSITNTIKRPDDIGVFRPALDIGWIDQEGAFDISQLAIEEAARLLGWRSPEVVRAEVEKIQARANKANLEKGVLNRKIARLEAQLAEYTEASVPA